MFVLVFGIFTRINSFLSSTSSIIIFISSSLRQAPAIPITISTFINKFLSSGALFRNLFTSFSRSKTYYINLLTISIPLFSFIIVFSIENSDHKLRGFARLLFLNTKYSNIFFSLISTSCSFYHIHNEAYANSFPLDFFAFHASSISPSLHRSSKTFSIIINKFQVK
ncbi:hypothetical protein C0J52_20126 [Blattella germanica]|nr:hypothetical protein C0J52_20126 [Blattella germanica]